MGRTDQAKPGSSLLVRVIPRAKVNEISGRLEDGTIKVRVKAPPVDGKANQELVGFLADFFGVRKSAVRIISGETNRNKSVFIEGIDRKSVQAKLAEEFD